MADTSWRWRLRQRLDEGAVMLGAWCALPGAGVELLASLDFDWVCLDMQHGLFDERSTVEGLRALDAHRMPCLVRVAANDPMLIGRVLDLGAAGVIVPMVECAEDAARAEAACRYPPRGSRSWGPLRATFGDPDYTPHQADEHVLCCVMAETPRAVDALVEIASVPGVDAILPGPNDLALTSTGERRPAITENGRLNALLEPIVKHCVEVGVALAAAAGGVAEAGFWRQQGARLIAVDSDVGLLAGAACGALEELRDGVHP